MATSYYANNWANQVRVQSNAGDFTEVFLFTVSTALVTADKIYLCKIPQGVEFLSWFIDVPDLDTNVSPAITFILGDEDDDDRFLVDQGTVGQSAGKLNSMSNGVNGILPKGYSADKSFILKVGTGPGTGATAVGIRGWCKFHKYGISAGV